jgi:uncharacterized protein (TIGR02145 family)
MSCKKINISIGLCHFIAAGFILILTNSCRKDLTNSIIHLDNYQDTDLYTASVTIGTQVWMTKNLKTRRYRNGDKIWTTTPSTLDITIEFTPKYQWVYDGDDRNIDIYGRLYTWYAVTDPRNICPKGWHVPTDEDWTTLTTYLDGKIYAGDNLKEEGTTHWINPNTGATNATGFTALPGGYRFYYGRFSDIGFSGFWWSSSEASDSIAYGRGILSNISQVPRFNFSKRDGLSVRCIMDQ